MDKIAEITSKYLVGELSEQELKELKINLQKNEEYSNELYFQQDILKLIKNTYNTDEIEQEIEDKKLDIEVEQIVSNWKNNANKNEELEELINKGIDAYENKVYMAEAEELEKEIELFGLDNEIDEMFKNKSKKEFDFELSGIINDSIDKFEEDNPRLVKKDETNIKMFTTKKHYYFAAAAVATIIITFGVVLFELSYNSSPQKLVSDLYDKPKITLYVVRDDTNIEDILLTKAMDSYKEGEYQRSIKELTEIIQQNPKNKQAIFYLAMSYYEIGNYTEAIKLLNSHLTTFNDKDPNINWYLGISYLQTEEIEKAIQQFKLIEKSSYRKDVRKILRNID